MRQTSQIQTMGDHRPFRSSPKLSLLIPVTTSSNAISATYRMTTDRTPSAFRRIDGEISLRFAVVVSVGKSLYVVNICFVQSILLVEIVRCLDTPKLIISW